MSIRGLIQPRSIGIFANSILLFVLALFLKSRILNYPVSVGWDEDIFRLIGQRWFLDGELPLVSTFENKPPFAYLPYVLPYVFTSTPTVILTNLIVIGVSVLICLLLANIFAGGRFWAKIVISFVSLCAVYVLPQGLSRLTVIKSCNARYLDIQKHKDLWKIYNRYFR